MAKYLYTLLVLSLLGLGAPGCTHEPDYSSAGGGDTSDVRREDAARADAGDSSNPGLDAQGRDEDARRTDASGPRDDASGPLADAAQDAVEDAAPDATPTPDPFNPDIPARITTHGALFAGNMTADTVYATELVAEQGDRVAMWLRVQGERTWSPVLFLKKQGRADVLVSSTPLNQTDAHIPYQADQLARGWEFPQGGSFRLELGNRGDVDGRFEFFLQCVAGPCLDLSPQGDAPQNPVETLRDDTLLNVLRRAHQGHRALSYNDARDFIFDYEIRKDGKVECVYTGRKVTARDRLQAQSHGFNTEHTWPQSRGAGSLPAKSDMHHLWAVDEGANSRRSNHFFDIVTNATWQEGGSRLGTNAQRDTRFEPRDVHKGNVARGLFYFSVIYNKPIEPDEEAALRAWHRLDPPDDDERQRNDEIFGAQGSRNPFIDWPELVDQIADF